MSWDGWAAGDTRGAGYGGVAGAPPSRASRGAGCRISGTAAV